MAKKKVTTDFLNRVKRWLDEGVVTSIQLDLVHYLNENCNEMNEESADMVDFHIIEEDLRHAMA